jgi:hypothetical protein
MRKAKSIASPLVGEAAAKQRVRGVSIENISVHDKLPWPHRERARMRAEVSPQIYYVEGLEKPKHCIFFSARSMSL